MSKRHRGVLRRGYFSTSWPKHYCELTGRRLLNRGNHPISTIVSLKLPNINHCIAGATQYQPFYRWNCPISTSVSLEPPNINHCIVGTAQYQPFISPEPPNIDHCIVGTAQYQPLYRWYLSFPSSVEEALPTVQLLLRVGCRVRYILQPQLLK